METPTVQKKKTGTWKWIVGGLLGLGIIGKLTAPDGSTSQSNTKDSTATQTSISSELPPATKVENMLEGLKKSKSSTYTTTTEIDIQLAVFAAYKQTIDEAELSGDPKAISLAKQLRRKVAVYQQNEFPKMRKAFIKQMAEKMWEENIYVTGKGKASNIISLTGGIFASNKNIKQVQETLNVRLQNMRFKQAEYRWYKGQDEFTFYDLKPNADGELFTILQ